MSLINDLLTDLENRRGGHREQQTVFADLAAVSDNFDSGYRSTGGTRLVWLAVLVIVVGVAGYLWLERTTGIRHLSVQAANQEKTVSEQLPPEAQFTAANNEVEEPEAVVEVADPEVEDYAALVAENRMPLQLATSLSAVPTAATDETPVVARDDGQQAVPQPVTAPEIATAALRRIQVDEENGAVRLKLSLAGKPEHRAYLLSDPHRVVVEFEHAVYEVSEDASSAGHSHIKAIRNGKHDDALKVVFDLDQPMKLVDSRYVSDADASQLLLSLQPQTTMAEPAIKADAPKAVAAADTADSPVVIQNRQMQKRPRTQPVERAERDDYERGLYHYSRSEFQQSIVALSSAVDHNPQHGRAHYLLVSALLQLNQRAAAEQHLERALQEIPDHWDMRRLYAHLLTDRGDLDGALSVLRQASPRLSDDPDYHALIAALHQQLEDHVPAMQVYRQLVEVRPGNSVWWMGLGISLEALARPEEALLSYRRALDSGALAADLRQFVSGRIQSLTGEQSS